MAKSAEFEVGDTVLAKQKGFPAWPAVIVESSDVPESVLAAKPRRKNVFPVLFYGENNFMWANDADMKLLTVPEARKNSKIPKTSRKLKNAYKIAIERPHYKDYIAQAFGSDDAEEPEPEEGTRRTRTKAKRAAEMAPSKPTTRATRTSTSRTANRKRPASAKGGSAKKQKIEESGEDEDYEEDHDAVDELEEAEAEEELDVMETDSSSDAAATPSKKRRKATSEEPFQTTEQRLNLFKEVRSQLQGGFLDKPKPDSKAIPKLSEALKLVESIEDIEISIVRQSKIYRVLYLIVHHVKEIPQDSRYHIRSRAEKLLENWNTPAEPIIRGIPEELAVKEETEDVSTVQSSRDVSLAPSDAPTPAEPLNEESKQVESNGGQESEPKVEVISEEPLVDGPNGDQAKVDEPKADEPKADEPKADEPKVDEPKVDEPNVDEPKVDEPKAEEVVAQETAV